MIDFEPGVSSPKSTFGEPIIWCASSLETNGKRPFGLPMYISSTKWCLSVSPTPRHTSSTWWTIYFGSISITSWWSTLTTSYAKTRFYVIGAYPCSRFLMPRVIYKLTFASTMEWEENYHMTNSTIYVNSLKVFMITICMTKWTIALVITPTTNTKHD